jgi:hypothetical protein
MTCRTFFSIPIIFLLLVSCGFKVVNQSDLANFSISNINMNGEKRINYYLKNTLSFSAKNNKNVNPISLNIVSQKNKNIKEKNIKNEITKYALEIIVSVELIDANNKSKTIQVREIGDYTVAARHSQTLNNEKNLIKKMSDNLANIILKKLTTVIDDL